MKVAVKFKSGIVKFKDVPTGACWYHPDSETLYMKTSLKGTAKTVALGTGIIHPTTADSNCIILHNLKITEE